MPRTIGTRTGKRKREAGPENSYWGRILNEFLKGDYQGLRTVCKDGYSSHCCAYSFRRFKKLYDLDVKVMKQGDVIHVDRNNKIGDKYLIKIQKE